MEDRRLTYILKIAEESSISSAAQKLYISQPSLSQFLQKLEKEIGCPLFDRSTTPLRPTYIGRLYLQTARQILTLKEQFRQQTDDVLNLRRGHLTIGTSPFRSTHLLAGFLPIFQQQYPGIDITLVENTTMKLETLAQSAETDLSISLLPSNTAVFSYVPLFQEELLLVLPPQHPLCAKHRLPNTLQEQLPVIDLGELRDTPFILMNQEQKLHHQLISLCQSAGFTPRIQLETQSMDAAQALAGAGIGATLLPDTLIRAVHPEKKPCYAALAVHPARTAILIWPKDHYVSHAAKAFIHTLQAYFAKNS